MESDKMDHGANASTSRHELTPHEYGLRAMLNSYEFSPMAPTTSGVDANAQSRVISRILADTFSPARGGVEVDERRAAGIYARSLPLDNDTVDNVLAMIDRREEQALVREMAAQLRNELSNNAPLLIDRPEALEQAAIEAIDVDEVDKALEHMVSKYRAAGILPAEEAAPATPTQETKDTQIAARVRARIGYDPRPVIEDLNVTPPMGRTRRV